MKWTTWLLFALALGVFGAVAAMVARQSTRTPVEALSTLQAQIDADEIEDETALVHLDLLLQRAEAAQDRAVASEVRLLRASVLTRIGSWERARADLEAVRDERGAPRAIDERLIDLEAQAGDMNAALVRVEALLAADPAYTGGWSRVGSLQARIAARALAHARQIADRALAAEDAERARERFDLLGSLDPSDAARVALGHHVRALFAPEQSEQAEYVLQACDESARASQAAREAFTCVLEREVDPAAVAGLMELFARAGHSAEAASLFAVAQRIPEVQQHLPSATQGLTTLLELERWRFASEVVNGWLNRKAPAPPAFYAMACKALHRAERWGQLWAGAQELLAVADGAQAPWAWFYFGLSHIHQKDIGKEWLETGRIELVTRFLNTGASEPEPGARALAWRTAAWASRELGDASTEREHLKGALDLDPDHDGELWLRLAELQVQSPNAGYRDPEARWAKGMSLLPKRVAELMPRWRELGELELRAAGIDSRAQRAEAQSRRAWVAPTGASPYELYRLAEVCLEEKDGPRAVLYSQKLLHDLPGFLPALDIAIEVARIDGRTQELIRLCVERVRVAGGDEHTAALLRAIPPSSIQPVDALALMRGDPERFGRVVVARALEARGEHERALLMLQELPPETLGMQARVQMAELHVDAGDPRAALETLDAVGRKVLSDVEATFLYVRAALRAGDRERLERALTGLKEADELKPGRTLALADLLLAAGQSDFARGLLEPLDANPATRSGELVLRLAQVALLEKDETALAPLTERTQAFETSGALELIELLAAADAGRWDDVERWANALSESHFRGTPLQRALLALLSDHGPGARTLIEEALAKEPRQPQWRLAQSVECALAGRAFEPPPYFGATVLAETERFLHGLERQADPRFVAALQLAATVPAGVGWARLRTESLSKRVRGTLWRAWLLAQLARNQDDRARAREVLGGLLTQHPGFGPAWDALERLLPDDDGALAARIKLREKRRQALGALGGPKHERLLDEARALALRGDRDAALALLAEAALAPAASSSVHSAIAGLLMERGDVEGALRAQRTAFQLEKRYHSPRDLGRHLELMRRAERMPSDDAQGASATAVAELEALHSAHPANPRVVLELARADLASDLGHPSLGVARALARLGTFRAAHAEEALEAQAPGSLTAWVEFLFEVDPARAEELVRAEQALEPGSPEAWLLSARTLAEQGRLAEALAELRVIARLVPGGGVQRAMLRLLVTREQKPERLNQTMQAAMQSEGRETADPELVVLRAEGQWVLGPRTAGLVVDFLSPLETAAIDDADLADRWTVLRAIALCARGEPADLERVRALRAGRGASIRDPYRSSLVRALGGLATRAATPTGP